ncbi:MAG: ribonuclease P protein component [Spirochaetales bacterium]|jgi:ribonuclease P protein component|nr:ribonuclease P protein component [Spirochaetales bacterium]
MRKSLTRRERLRGTAALKRVFTFSRKIACPGVRLLLAKNGLDYNRVVVSPVRKFGGAVARNRARRVGKEAYRCIKSSIKPGFDLAFILFPGDFSYGERMSQFSFLLKKAGLLCED